jgi:ADP-heptose:LPS heptosyltransferase
MEQPQKKILLGMLVANGDCLLATVLARQIKKDYPGCHLTWAISNLCRQVIENNPDVDAIWEISLPDKKAGEKEGWFSFVAEAEKRKAGGEFDEVFFTQIYPSNVHYYDGTTRGTIYNAYPGKITVNATPVLRLKEEEIMKVRDFAAEHKLQNYKNVILFECSSFSGQSFVTSEWALTVSEKLLELYDDLFIIISTHQPLDTKQTRIAVAHTLSLRQNAELTKYCSLLVGCSSGITWMATTDWAKKLPMIQFLKRGIGFTFASVAWDHSYWGLDDSQILESTKDDIGHAVALISLVMEKGIVKSKPVFHQKLRPKFFSLLKYSFMYFRRGKFGKSFRIVLNFIKRNYLLTGRKL